jgi:hypothetical protein
LPKRQQNVTTVKQRSFLEGLQPPRKVVFLTANNLQGNYLDRQGILVSLIAHDLRGNYKFPWLLLTAKAIMISLWADTQGNLYEQQKKYS